jgi:hypothetical protein
MFFLRIFSFIAGSCVLFASPYVLLGREQPSASAATIVLAVLTVLLFASVYFFFALFGHRTTRSLRMRSVAAAMIAFQLMAGAWLLAASYNARALVAVAPLLCFTVFLFMAFVWPGQGAHSHRPMRRRERIDELQHH